MAASFSWVQLTSGLWRHHPHFCAPRPRCGRTFPPRPVSGWPHCLPGALSASLSPPVPCSKFLAWVLSSCLDPSETMGFLLLAGAALVVLCVVPCKDPKCPYTLYQDISPFSGLAGSSQSKQGPGAGAHGCMESVCFYLPECRKAQRCLHSHERSLLILIKLRCLHSWAVSGLLSRFPVRQTLSPLG